MYLNLIWKSPEFVPFGANLAHFSSKSDMPDVSDIRLLGDQLNILYTLFNEQTVQSILYQTYIRYLYGDRDDGRLIT